MADKLHWVLEQVRVLVEEQVGRGAGAAVLADSDPVFASALRRMLSARLAQLQHEIDADVRVGQVRPDVDAEALAGLAFGAYLGELLQHGRARRGWADRAVTLLLRALESTWPLSGPRSGRESAAARRALRPPRVGLGQEP